MNQIRREASPLTPDHRVGDAAHRSVFLPWAARLEKPRQIDRRPLVRKPCYQAAEEPPAGTGRSKVEKYASKTRQTR
jgi:hypothetical protein